MNVIAEIDNDMMWHDPNPRTKKVQVDKGTTAWGDPQTQGEIKRWKLPDDPNGMPKAQTATKSGLLKSAFTFCSHQCVQVGRLPIRRLATRRTLRRPQQAGAMRLLPLRVRHITWARVRGRRHQVAVKATVLLTPAAPGAKQCRRCVLHDFLHTCSLCVALHASIVVILCTLVA